VATADMPVCACGCSEKGKLVLAFGVDASKLGLVNTGQWSWASVTTSSRSALAQAVRCIFTALPCRSAGLRVASPPSQTDCAVQLS